MGRSPRLASGILWIAGAGHFLNGLFWALFFYNEVALAAALALSVIYWFLYRELKALRNAHSVRVALGVATLPLGLYYFFSPEVKRYCRQEASTAGSRA